MFRSRRVYRLFYRFNFRRKAGGKRQHTKRNLILISIVVLFATLWSLFEWKVQPIVEQLALTRVKYLASKSINDAINGEMSNGKYAYEDLVYFEKDSTGRISAVKTNMVKINQLKVELTNRVLERIANMDVSELSIPLGNVINGDLLSGQGPRIPVKILPVGSVNASFSNLFTSAGINQTRHQVVMEVWVNIGVVMPGRSIGTEVRVSVNIAETIIVGSVPESFTYFDETVKSPADTNAERYFDLK